MGGLTSQVGVQTGLGSGSSFGGRKVRPSYFSASSQLGVLGPVHREEMAEARLLGFHVMTNLTPKCISALLLAPLTPSKKGYTLNKKHRQVFCDICTGTWVNWMKPGIHWARFVQGTGQRSEYLAFRGVTHHLSGSGGGG